MNMSSATDIYTDFSSLTSLKAKARADQSGASAQVAEKFESLFLQMMLKSMRKASITDDGILKNETINKYRDMYDSQLANQLAASGGIGLASVIEKQLNGESHLSFNKDKGFSQYQSSPTLVHQAIESIQTKKTAVTNEDTNFDGSVKTFVDELKPYAQKAAALLGIQPEALIAQAALETGWGKHEMKKADGKPSYNLFGIKADQRWNGNKADVSTLEFRDGIAKKERANFRAYDSYQDSFDDYAKFIMGNSRYSQAVQNTDNPTSYFSNLQSSGYATDPEYANKIMSIFNRGDIQTAMNNNFLEEEG